MSKPKSKPKRVEYVTAASYEILSDERDALEGALTDLEQYRDHWKSEALRLEQVICDIKSAHKLEIDNYHKATIAERNSLAMNLDAVEHRLEIANGSIYQLNVRCHHLAVKFRQMCEYRDQWATQSAMWEEKCNQTFEKWAVESGNRSIMLDAVCHALETAQFEFELSQHFVKSWVDHAKWLVDELKRAKRNVFSKLWHWFTDPPSDDKALTDYLQGKTPRLKRS